MSLNIPEGYELHYAGRVVYRLCSQFIDPNDPIVETIGQIETWLKSQGGQG
ncbi:hypothetical protein [Mycobacteroides abscessus]